VWEESLDLVRALVGFEKRVCERVREVDTIFCFWWFAQV